MIPAVTRAVIRASNSALVGASPAAAATFAACLTRPALAVVALPAASADLAKPFSLVAISSSNSSSVPRGVAGVRLE